jgi:hypothetical protein
MLNWYLTAFQIYYTVNKKQQYYKSVESLGTKRSNWKIKIQSGSALGSFIISVHLLSYFRVFL